MDLQLTGRCVVLAGGGGEIGRAICRRMLQEGAHLVVGSRTADDLHSSDAIEHVEVDLNESAGAETLVGAATRSRGGVDVIINNVGPIVVRPNGFLHTSEDDLEESVATNLLIPWRMCQAALPTMVAKRAGTIINLASVVALQPTSVLVHYSAAKAALVTMSKALAQEFAPLGVRINVVSPSPIETSRTQAVLDLDYPTGRANTPDEVAALVTLVASPLLANVTGVNYRIDGGLVPDIV